MNILKLFCRDLQYIFSVVYHVNYNNFCKSKSVKVVLQLHLIWHDKHESKYCTGRHKNYFWSLIRLFVMLLCVVQCVSLTFFFSFILIYRFILLWCIKVYFPVARKQTATTTRKMLRQNDLASKNIYSNFMDVRSNASEFQNVIPNFD